MRRKRHRPKRIIHKLRMVGAGSQMSETERHIRALPRAIRHVAESWRCLLGRAYQMAQDISGGQWWASTLGTRCRE